MSEMEEMDFYIDAIDNLPATVDNKETVKEKFAHVFYDFLQLSHLYDSAIEVVKTYLNISKEQFAGYCRYKSYLLLYKRYLRHSGNACKT